MENDAELVHQVREVMATAFLMDESELPEDANQENCARWTSLYHLTLMIALEERFGLTFSMDEMTTMTSLSAIIAVLKRSGVIA